MFSCVEQCLCSLYKLTSRAFGLRSIEELKYAIFENRVAAKDIGTEATIENLQENATAVLNRGWRFSASRLVNTFWKSGSEVLQVLSFLSVTKQIVVLDDLERKGKDLRTQDVLGLVSLLRDQKKCKVVLIMNDDALEEEKRELLKYQEKVIDSSLLFAPNEEECVAIALDEEFPGRSHLREFCISLGISNIRVIKKIERLVIHVHPLLKDLDDKVFRQAVQTLTLFGWAYYSRIEGDGSTFLDFAVKKFLWGSTDQSKMTDTEGQWNRILDVYGFRNADDLDLILLDGIKVGFFDEDRLVREAKKLHDLHVAQQAEVSLEQAFRPLHDSFKHNQDEVIDSIIKGVKENIQFVSPGTLSAVVSIFKELGKDDLAKEALDFYVEQRGTAMANYPLDDPAFADNLSDPDVKEAFAAAKKKVEVAPDPVEILMRMSKNNSWYQSDEKVLAELSVDEYEKIFRELTGEELRRATGVISDIDRTSGASERMKEIAERGKKALYRIADDNALNRRRVRRFGFSPPPKVPKKLSLVRKSLLPIKDDQQKKESGE